jgi:hypothetical protein
MHRMANDRYSGGVRHRLARWVQAGRRLEAAWVAFAAANAADLLAMLALIVFAGPHGWETVPLPAAFGRPSLTRQSSDIT